MDIHHSISNFPSNLKTVLTIGTFDGIHKGHRYILQSLISESKRLGFSSVLLTFNPHPRNVLFPQGQDLKLLNTIDEKVLELQNIGIDHLIIHEFTKDFSRISPVNFIRDILVSKLNMQHMIVGYDHHFGRNREGSFEELQQLSDLYNFSLQKIEAHEFKDIKISSTKVRKALLEGNVHHAYNLLGYYYILSGVVLHGNKLGRKIGFPTANIEVDKNKLIPKPGVYVVKVSIEAQIYFGMLNIDIRTEKIEVHVFDFSEFIYDKIIQVYLISRLRDGKKMDSLEDLKSELINDEKKARVILQNKFA